MSTHSPQRGAGASLPDAVPFEFPASTRLSWELGSRVVDDDEAELLAEWHRSGGSWRLSIVRVTTNTVVFRLRTPVGRERFYGAAKLDLEEARSALAASPDWHRRE